MQDILLKILSEYKSEKETLFKENRLAAYVTRLVPDKLFGDIRIDRTQYHISGSVGKGRWADIPWIAIFDKDITTTATKGYYIVYLFCADMSGVYLSLNQGWTYFKDKYGKKNGIEKIEIVSNFWRTSLSSKLNDFISTSIYLKSLSNNSDLAKGYERGHILGKYYSFANMPDEEILRQDLLNLLGVYRELKGKLLRNDLGITNDQIISDNMIGLLPEEDSSTDTNEIDTLIAGDMNKVLVNLNNPPNEFREIATNNRLPRKVNFLKKIKNQKKIGLAGEKSILEYEKKLLQEADREDLISKIRHVSELDGDGLGYDILSFTPDGKPKYIEVKTTIKGIDEPFIITHNEVEVSKLHSNNYYLYRVYSFDAKKRQCELYILNGYIGNHFALKPREYLASNITREIE